MRRRLGPRTWEDGLAEDLKRDGSTVSAGGAELSEGEKRWCQSGQIVSDFSTQ